MVAVESFQMVCGPRGSARLLRRACGAMLLGIGLVASFTYDSQVEAALASPHRNLAPENPFNLVHDDVDEWTLEELSSGAFDLPSHASDTSDSPKVHRQEAEDLSPSAYRSTWVPFREVDSQPETNYFANPGDQAMEAQVHQAANDPIPNKYYDAIENSDSSWMAST